MLEEGRFSGTRREIAYNWPLYFLGFGGSLLALLVATLLALSRGWWGITLISLALFVVAAYFLVVRVWAAYEQHDRHGQQPAQVLAALAQLRPNSRFVHLGLGRRLTPLQLSRRLTSGHLTVIDLYNPQLTPSPSLARAREKQRRAVGDPRLTWLDGTIDLLPLPDGSVEVVTGSHLLREFWQHGDRELLLRETRRILAPGGRLVLLEKSRSSTNWLVVGPGGWHLPTVDYWRHLFEGAGFRLIKEGSIKGLAHYFVVEKPLSGEIQQLRFDFGL